MTSRVYKWLVPAVALVLGLLISFAELGQNASPAQAASALVIVGGYAVALVFLRSRSETASLLSGLPVDERWDSINQRSLAFAAQLIACVLVGAFIVVSFRGGDAMPYAWTAAVFAVGYLGSILWYRWRS
jgi:hypothetical protein